MLKGLLILIFSLITINLVLLFNVCNQSSGPVIKQLSKATIVKNVKTGSGLVFHSVELQKRVSKKLDILLNKENKYRGLMAVFWFLKMILFFIQVITEWLILRKRNALTVVRCFNWHL